jgi:hypothetical protein
MILHDLNKEEARELAHKNLVEYRSVLGKRSLENPEP